MNSPRIIRVGGEMMNSYRTLGIEDRVSGFQDMVRGLLHQIMMDPDTSPNRIDTIIHGLKDDIATLEEWRDRNSVPKTERTGLDPDSY